MDEQKIEVLEIPAKNDKVVSEPIGDRIIGEIDPRTLTEEEFSRSTDVLFHGAVKPFNFSPDFDYSSAEYCTESDGSQTLGQGFYLTDDRESALNYSVVRQNAEKSDPVVLTLLPY